MSPNLTNPLYHLSRRVIAQGCFLLDRGSVGTRLAPAEDVDTAGPENSLCEPCGVLPAVLTHSKGGSAGATSLGSDEAGSLAPSLLIQPATKQGRSFTPDATGGLGLSMRHLCFTGWPLTIDYDRQAPS